MELDNVFGQLLKMRMSAEACWLSLGIEKSHDHRARKPSDHPCFWKMKNRREGGDGGRVIPCLVAAVDPNKLRTPLS